MENRLIAIKIDKKFTIRSYQLSLNNLNVYRTMFVIRRMLGSERRMCKVGIDFLSIELKLKLSEINRMFSYGSNQKKDKSTRKLPQEN